MCRVPVCMPNYGLYVGFGPGQMNRMVTMHMRGKSPNIRIYHECEGRIENPVLRILVWHHEACRVIQIGDQEGQIFLSYPLSNNGFFFYLLNTVFFKTK